MSFQDCGVEFHGSPQGVLYSGQMVTGAFYIKQEEPKEIKGLYYRITGKTKTRWSEDYGTGKNRKTVVYSGIESNIDTAVTTLLEGYPMKNGNVIIEAGLSKFYFSFTLPRGLRSSFQGTYGKTKYKMNVTAERANKFDKTKKFPFTIVCSTDLNLNLENCMPIKEVVSKNFSSFLGDKGYLKMTIDLPMTGYIPGHQIPIKCLVINKSRVFISSVTFSLERTVTYYSTSPSRSVKTEKHKMVEFVGDKVDKDSASMLQVALSLSALQPSCPMDELITMEYFVKVKAVVTGMHSNLKTMVPVNIGTIPVYALNYAAPSTSAAFRQQQINVPVTAYYPSCPDLSQVPHPDAPSLLRPGVPPFRSSQFPPSLQNSQHPPFRSLNLLPTPSAPPLYADLERSRDSGLPTYEEAQMLAKMVKVDPDNEEHRVEESPTDLVFQFPTQSTSPWI